MLSLKLVIVLKNTTCIIIINLSLFDLIHI